MLSLGLVSKTLLVSMALIASATEQSPMNVLFIVTDDLRPELSIYGRGAYTPNFDRLAAKGIVFDLAYTQYAVCSPSRASFLTGVRPDTQNYPGTVTT